MKLLHLYLEGGPAPPMTSSICVFHLGISLVRRPRRFRLAQRPHQLLQSNPAKLKPPFEPLKGRGNTEGKSQPVATVLAATASATG